MNAIVFDEAFVSGKSRFIALALAIALGIFGFDRFYTGRWWRGILKLLTLGGIGIWWVIDIIMLVFGRYRDGQGLLIRKWF